MGGLPGGRGADRRRAGPIHALVARHVARPHQAWPMPCAPIIALFARTKEKPHFLVPTLAKASMGAGALGAMVAMRK